MFPGYTLICSTLCSKFIRNVFYIVFLIYTLIPFTERSLLKLCCVLHSVPNSYHVSYRSFLIYTLMCSTFIPWYALQNVPDLYHDMFAESSHFIHLITQPNIFCTADDTVMQSAAYCVHRCAVCNQHTTLCRIWYNDSIINFCLCTLQVWYHSAGWMSLSNT
jgi:hypothetical protein